MVLCTSEHVAMAVRTLDLVDQEIRAATNQPKLRLPAVVLSSKHILSDTPDAGKHFQHLNVTIQAIRNSPRAVGGGQLQHIAAVASQHDAQWVLILADTLQPMEHWLWNLLSTLLSSPAKLKAAKSVTLSKEGDISSAGLQHQYTVVGDGKILTLPFMLLRCETSPQWSPQQQAQCKLHSGHGAYAEAIT